MWTYLEIVAAIFELRRKDNSCAGSADARELAMLDRSVLCAVGN